MQFTPINMQVQGFVQWFITMMGDAMAAVGNHIQISAASDVEMGKLTVGIFGTTDGLLYWINDKIFYVIAGLQTADIGGLISNIMGAF